MISYDFTSLFIITMKDQGWMLAPLGASQLSAIISLIRSSGTSLSWNILTALLVLRSSLKSTYTST